MVITAQQDIDGALAAAQCVTTTHLRLVEYLQVGRTLGQVDRFVAETLSSLKCPRSAAMNRTQVHPPLASHPCLSIHDCFLNVTDDMTDKPLAPGYILSVDIGVIHQGWIGDAAWTYAIGEATDEALKLMACGRESLRRGIASVKAGRPLVDWARTLQPYVEEDCGYYLVRGLGGHGYGRKLHGPPFLSNVTPRHPSELPDAWETFKPGMLLAVEPMIAVGSGDIISDGKTWPIYTADGSLSVHYEADILVTENGVRDLTDGMSQLPDIVK